MKTWTILLVSAQLAQAYDRIAGYSPASLVTDYNAIDQDQERITHYLEEVDPPDYSAVYDMYTRGGASKSTATLTLSSSTHSIEYGDAVSGTALDGSAATGDVSGVDGAEIKVKYTVASSQTDSHANCRVGGLPSADQITSGCFNNSEPLTIGGTSYSPTSIDNTKAGRTLQGFSTTNRLRSCSGSCPYPLFVDYANWYGVDDYGDKFVLGALGTPANGFTAGNVGFLEHNMDFSGSSSSARFELIEKGIMQLNVWMYVYRMLMVASDQCQPNCIACNDASVRSWDGAVAFYTGSLEGDEGDLEAGKFPHNQADKRCHNFLTCGPEGGDSTGTAMVNFEMFKLMQEGQSALLMGNCAGVPPLIASIVNQMSIPLIQGSIRYAEICARTGDRALSNPEKAQAERTAFAAAIVPRIAACPAEKYPEAVADAEVLWTNLEHGAGVGDFPLVKKTFEKYYPCLNITCEMVGGFYDSFRKQYNEGAEPCVTVEANAQLLSNEAVVGVIAGGGVALLGCLIACFCVKRLVSAEKKGKPIFTPLADAGRPAATA